MKKVLFLITTLKGGGAEKVLSTLVKHLDKRKYDITVMTINDAGVYREEVKKYARYKFCFRELKPGKNVFKKAFNVIWGEKIKTFIEDHPKLFYKLFIKGKYDIEIAFLENHCAKIIANSSNGESKKYLWIHTDVQANNWVKNRFKDIKDQKNSYAAFDKIFCVSKDTKESFNRTFGLEDKTFVQYNPNDEVDIIQKSKSNLDDIIVTNIFKVVTVGRFIEQKGYDRLLKVHKRLIDEGFNYELWFIGDGIEKKSYEDFIIQNNLSKSVKLLGFKQNPYKYMAQCNLFVCSSRAEGYSLVIAEALILGLPVVSTNCSGPIELLKDGESGIVTENSEEGIYIGFKQILSNQKIYDEYKNRAIKRSSFFKLSTILEQYESILDE